MAMRQAAGIVLALAMAAGAVGAGEAAEANDRPSETGARGSGPVTLEMRDGSRLVGEVVEEDGRRVRLRTLGGLEVDVPLADIVDRRERGEARRRTDPNYSRLMFAPTGRPLRKGDGYFSDYELLFPGLSYGITDHLTLSGGVSTIPGIGLGDQLFYISPKLGFELGDRQAYSVGFLYAAGGGEYDHAQLGIAYGVGTFGTRRASLSIGFGLGGDLADDGLRSPILMLGGQVSVGANVALVGESWLALRDTDFAQQPLGLAVRFYGGRLSADVGVVLVADLLDEGYPLPWVSVSYHFGPTRPASAVSTRASVRTRGTR
jgi:hypothetical protein